MGQPAADNQLTSIIIFVVVFLLLSFPQGIVDGSECKQSTTLDYKECGLARDSSEDTCAQTGYGTGTWWKLNLDGYMKISMFKIKGDLGFFEVRVGNNSDQYGRRSGFELNRPCMANMEKFIKVRDGIQSFYCKEPLYGNTFSLQHVDPVDVRSLVICNLTIF